MQDNLDPWKISSSAMLVRYSIMGFRISRRIFFSLNYDNSSTTTGSSSGFLCCALLCRTDASKGRVSSELRWNLAAEQTWQCLHLWLVFTLPAVKISTTFPPNGFKKSSSSPGWKCWYLKCWSLWVGRVLSAAYFVNENMKRFLSLRLELKQTNQRNKKLCNGVITKLCSFQYKLS